jgi:hypothetical protein
VPQIVIKSGQILRDGREDVITEYMCDVPGCPNIATQVVGRVRDLALARVVCREHLIEQQRSSRNRTRT